MTKGLRISPHLTLPTDYATKSAAILAQRRKGKSYTAAVVAEEMVANEIPFVILDPTGAHWGLRASADGKREGLPVYVFGGEHPSDPDLPLERTAGKLIADFVVDYPGYYVIDFKGFDSKAAEREFATDFAERLYRYKGQPGKDFAMHLFVDEADMFTPQRTPRGDERMLGAFESIVRRGGIRGLGTTLISQRAAVVNKNVLEQVDILIVLRTVGPNDRDAIRRYVVANGDEDEVAELMESLASLELGEAWVWEPGADPALFENVSIRARRTFNSSATPKPGQKRVEPKQLADVELKALRQRMAETIERAEASDPRKLQAKVRELEAKLFRPQIDIQKVTVTKEVEVPVVSSDFLDKLDGALAAVERAGNDLSAIVGDALSEMRSTVIRIHQQRELTATGDRSRMTPVTKAAEPQPARPVAASSRGASGPGDGSLPKAERVILTVLAQFPSGRTRNQIAIQSGYSSTSSHIDNTISKLRGKGLVQPPGGLIRITEEGITALGDNWSPLPNGEDLFEYWKRQVGKAGALFLDQLHRAYPGTMTRDELAEATGYSVESSHPDNVLSRLRTLELVTKGTPRLTDAFWEAITSS